MYDCVDWKGDQLLERGWNGDVFIWSLGTRSRGRKQERREREQSLVEPLISRGGSLRTSSACSTPLPLGGSFPRLLLAPQPSPPPKAEHEHFVPHESTCPNRISFPPRTDPRQRAYTSGPSPHPARRAVVQSAGGGALRSWGGAGTRGGRSETASAVTE